MPIERFEVPGEVSYNGVSFGALHRLTGYKVTPVADEAGRTAVYNKLELGFRFHVQFDPRAPVGRSQNALEFLQRSLTKPAGRFRWDRRGVGLLDVNPPGSGGVRDVNYGPVPKVLSLNLLGASADDSAGDTATWEVEWAVEICIPQCADARYQFAPMEYGYEVSYRIDKGLTTRTVSGYVRVPATRRTVSDRSLTDTADQYRELVVPGRLAGFRRTQNGEYRLDYAKTRLTFTVVDEQLPGPAPPPGVLEWDLSESLSTTNAAMTMWTGVVEGQYEAAPGADPRQMQAHFLTLAADRLNHLKQSLGVANRTTFVTGLRVANPSLAGAGRFTASLGFRLQSANLTAFLGDHGLWRPLPETGGWAAWDRSMGAVFSPRGLAGLYLAPDQDQIVDLCKPPATNGPQAAAPARPPRDAVLRGGLFPRPKPSESWLRYRAWVQLEVDGGTSVLRTLPKAPKEATLKGGPGVGTETELRSYFSDTGSSAEPLRVGGQLLSEPAPPRPGDKPEVRVEPHCTPVVTLYVNVRAERVGYPVPAPTLYDAAGQELKPVLLPGEVCWATGEVGNLGDETVYGAWGRLRYTLPSDVAAGLTLDDLVLYNPTLHSRR